MSITEGEDKPEKYPLAFCLAKFMPLTKIDLLPYMPFDLDACEQSAKKINPNIKIIKTSSFNKEGLDKWEEYLKAKAKK